MPFAHPRSCRLVVALGLVVPLASVGAASADPRPWADPPAKAAASSEVAKAASAPAREAASSTPVPDVKPDATTVATRSGAAQTREASRASAEHRPPVTARADDGRTRVKLQKSEARARPEARSPRPVPRLAETPTASAPIIAVARGPVPGGRAEAARALAASYLAAVSGPNEAMVGSSPHFYGGQVRFYGRATTRTALMAEKRGFVRRWPERRYEPRAFRTTCTPGGETCTVRALVAFRAANPARGAVSRGSTELVLEVSFAGARPVIVAESGRVLRRGA